MIIRMTHQDVEGAEHVEGRIYISVDTPTSWRPRVWMGPESFQALRDVVGQDGEAWCEVPEEQVQWKYRKAVPPELEASEDAEDEDVEELDEPGMDIFECWCGWVDDGQYTHDEYAAGVELQFGERGYPPHEPSENWNIPEPE